MAQEYPSRYVGRGIAPSGCAHGSCSRAVARGYDAAMGDERLIALVDANLVAFGRHIAGSIPAGTLEERGDVLLIAGDDPTPVIVNSAFATGPSADPGRSCRPPPRSSAGSAMATASGRGRTPTRPWKPCCRRRASRSTSTCR